MKHLSPAEIETIRVPEPKHDPFSLESLVAWLERQPKNAPYCYGDNGKCLLATYFSETLGRAVVLGDTYLRFKDSGISQGLPRHFNDIAIGRALSGDWTFGAALTRARAALASQKGNANG